MIKKFLQKEIPEGPIEAGQTLGMSPKEVLTTYLDRRNKILTLLRVYSQKTLPYIAEQIGISEAELKRIENSDDRVPYQLVPKLAKVFGVDLKMLLTFLGHAKWPDADRKDSEAYQFAMAAQYSGPELRHQEKIDLEELFRKILETAKTNSRGEDKKDRLHPK